MKCNVELCQRISKNIKHQPGPCKRSLITKKYQVFQLKVSVGQYLVLTLPALTISQGQLGWKYNKIFCPDDLICVYTFTIYVSISSIFGIYLQLQHNMSSPHPQLSELRNVLKTLQSAVQSLSQSICLLELVLEDSWKFL